MAPDALASRPARPLVFIGFMGAGKSTAAAAVAHALGSIPRDSDAQLEERFGHSIAEEIDRHGEAAFRRAEEEAVLEMLDAAEPGSVISLGGGSVLSKRTREALGEALVVYLDVDPHLAWKRVSGAHSERPLARERDPFLALHAERASLYEELADAVLPAGAPAPCQARPASEQAGGRADEKPAGVALRALPALNRLAGAPCRARMLWASSCSGEYPVLLSSGLLAGGSEAGAGPAPWSGAAAAGALWPLDLASSRAYCVSDRSVAPLYGSALGQTAAMIAIAPGEESKSLAGAELVWSELALAGMTRADHVVALGGGVVGDLAGFCAATYQRGVPIVHVPSTLVAQVDSAYGGKTGIDLPMAKNYVGAYHQPAGVLVDPQLLSTLPPRELNAGWVEVLKTALIAGGELWRAVSADEPVGEGTIFGCVRLKLGVVAEDERDAGRRQVLNLGHTVGHAIEVVTGYRHYRHGEAVGLGLLAALSLSGQPELRAHVRELLQVHSLPVHLDGASADDVVSALGFDKKRLGGADGATPIPPFVLVRAPGEVEHGCVVAEGEVRRAVEELVSP
ncbi:MAG: bifunctional shikimate kinase/3-dehydroquinate synthase [Solirubrobacteraceae bacterium]